MLRNNFTLASSGRDTLTPLGIQFRPFANSVHDIKDHERCSVGKGHFAHEPRVVTMKW
jgi:hypothetical protein